MLTVARRPSKAKAIEVRAVRLRCRSCRPPARQYQRLGRMRRIVTFSISFSLSPSYIHKQDGACCTARLCALDEHSDCQQEAGCRLDHVRDHRQHPGKSWCERAHLITLMTEPLAG